MVTRDMRLLQSTVKPNVPAILAGQERRQDYYGGGGVTEKPTNSAILAGQERRQEHGGDGGVTGEKVRILRTTTSTGGWMEETP